jgi:spore maturation protein B
MKTLQDVVQILSTFVIVAVLAGFPLYGLIKRVPVYEVFVEGAKEGFTLVVKIIPYLVGILFAMAMFRASGAMDFLIRGLRPVLTFTGFPPEDLTMAIMRPLTSSGSIGILADMIKQYGLDSIYVKIAAVIFGSSETTFYVIAVYFGSVGVTKVRHAILAGLVAEGSAILASVYLVKWMYGGGHEQPYSRRDLRGVVDRAGDRVRRRRRTPQALRLRPARAGAGARSLVHVPRLGRGPRPRHL